MTTNAGNASSLDRAKVLGIVKEELAEILEKSPDEIVEDVPFTDLGADSLALIELVEALELAIDAVGSVQQARVTGSAGAAFDAAALLSVRDAVDYVVVKLQVA